MNVSYQTQDEVPELTVMHQYIKMLNSTLCSNSYLETAYSVFQAGIIDKADLEDILVLSGPYKSPLQATTEAIQTGITRKPWLFHKLVHLLRRMHMKSIAAKLQAGYGKNCHFFVVSQLNKTCT